ncbi:phosphotransferase enzyme family protein [Paenibacillus cremeus]|nr:phosphotransferase [Paenibacillus cremeus]
MQKELIVQAAANAFGLDSNLLAYVGGNVNEIYQHPAQNGYPARVLRLSNQQFRSELEAVAELHFMNYLFENGVSVPKIFPSKAGQWVENVTEGHHASVFSQAPGRIPTDEDWNPKLFIQWGRILGQMHLLTQSYLPLKEIKRKPWSEDPWMDLMRLPTEETIARQKAAELLSWLHTLPTDSKNYGLIHSDLHSKNIFVTEDGTVTAFDFDDCLYHWFAYDIAIILYLAILRFNRQAQAQASGARDDQVAWFLDSFLKGYQEMLPIDPWWLQAIPKFLSLRRLSDFHFLHQRYDWNTVEGELKTTWLRMKAEIEADEPLTKVL